jgi:hypothetical protein
MLLLGEAPVEGRKVSGEHSREAVPHWCPVCFAEVKRGGVSFHGCCFSHVASVFRLSRWPTETGGTSRKDDVARFAARRLRDLHGQARYVDGLQVVDRLAAHLLPAVCS